MKGGRSSVAYASRKDGDHGLTMVLEQQLERTMASLVGSSGVASPMALLASDEIDHVRGMIFTRYRVHGTDIRLPQLGHQFIGLAEFISRQLIRVAIITFFVTVFITRIPNQAVSSVIAHMSHIQVPEKDHCLPTQRARPGAATPDERQWNSAVDSHAQRQMTG